MRKRRRVVAAITSQNKRAAKDALHKPSTSPRMGRRSRKVENHTRGKQASPRDQRSAKTDFHASDRFAVFLVESAGSPEPDDFGRVPPETQLRSLNKVLVNLVNLRTGHVWKTPPVEELHRMPLGRYTWAPALEQPRPGALQHGSNVATTQLTDTWHMQPEAVRTVTACLKRDFPAWFTHWAHHYGLSS